MTRQEQTAAITPSIAKPQIDPPVIKGSNRSTKQGRAREGNLLIATALLTGAGRNSYRRGCLWRRYGVSIHLEVAMAISGTIKVTSAGTRVQAAHKGNVRAVVFKARAGNTGDVYLGGNDVSSTDGMTLSPGESIQVSLANPESTSQFWADAASNNDQIDFVGSP